MRCRSQRNSPSRKRWRRSSFRILTPRDRGPFRPRSGGEAGDPRVGGGGGGWGAASRGGGGRVRWGSPSQEAGKRHDTILRKWASERSGILSYRIGPPEIGETAQRGNLSGPSGCAA